MLMKIYIFTYIFLILDAFDLIENKQITINLLRKDPTRENNDLENLLKVYAKDTNNHSIALYRYFDTEFYGEVKIGSRNKTFNVLYNTAWSNSWVLSALCPSTKIGCFHHQKYDHKTSATANVTDEKFLMNQGPLKMSGTYTYDNINVGGLKVTNHKFAEVTDIPWTNILTKSDGIIGLGLSYGNEKSFFQSLVEQRIIKRGLFSLYLNRDRSSNRGGDISLGFYTTKHIHVTNKVFDEITYVPVDGSRGYWQFSMDGVYVEEKKMVTPGCTQKCVAIVDSTSNTIVVPQKSFALLNAVIETTPVAFGFYGVDCDKINTLPKLRFEIGGTNFSLTGKQYIQTISYKPAQLCISALQPNEDPKETVWILGGSFLSMYYSIYDIDNLQIGFVRAA